MRQRVLFLCTHNAARSQMAEAFVRAVAGDRFDVASAGTEATPRRRSIASSLTKIQHRIREWLVDAAA